MKKLLLITCLSCTCMNSKAQNNIGLGVGAGIFAVGGITTYFVLNKRDLKQNYPDQPIDNVVKNDVRKNNLPWLLCGAGCGILSAASFIDGAVIRKSKSKSLTIAAKGNSIGLAFNF